MNFEPPRSGAGDPTLGRPKVAVLSVSDPFSESIETALAELAQLTRVASQSELEDHLSSGQRFDLALAAHWRWRIPEDALKAWRWVGIHTSPLPYVRGGSPIQNQIVRGEYGSQVCAIRMTSETEAGGTFSRSHFTGDAGT